MIKDILKYVKVKNKKLSQKEKNQRIKDIEPNASIGRNLLKAEDGDEKKCFTTRSKTNRKRRCER